MTIIWSVVIALGLLIEIFTFELVSIWFSVGAILALILQISGVGLVWQLVSFFAVSIVAIILTRPLFKRILAKSEGNTNLDALVGDRYKVLTPITVDDKGTIKIKGVVWNAVEVDEEPCDVDDLVEVVRFKGTTVIVRKVKSNNTETDTKIEEVQD